MQEEERLTMEQEALEALRESTKRLEVAEQLLRVGNIREAERLRDEARQKRHVSIWLMKQAKASTNH